MLDGVRLCTPGTATVGRHDRGVHGLWRVVQQVGRHSVARVLDCDGVGDCSRVFVEPAYVLRPQGELARVWNDNPLRAQHPILQRVAEIAQVRLALNLIGDDAGAKSCWLRAPSLERKLLDERVQISRVDHRRSDSSGGSSASPQ